MTEEQYDALIAAVRAIAHGPVSGPTGLELVAVAMSRTEDASVAASLDRVASAIERLADAVEGSP
jgi:hypothetical protein